jgi:hypothetical protein
MQIRKRRRELWLSSQQSSWELSVAEEAERRSRTRPEAALLLNLGFCRCRR